MKTLSDLINPSHLVPFMRKPLCGLAAFMLVLIFCSCNTTLHIPGQDRRMPSSYTHSGKYTNHHTFGVRHDGIRKYTLKCPISDSK